MKRIFQKLKAFFKIIFSKKNKANPVQPIVSQKRVMAGMKVWECDITTGTIAEAEISVSSYVDSKGKSRKNRKVLIRKNCMYEYAMNGENATRKFEARILQLFKTQQN